MPSPRPCQVPSVPSLLSLLSVLWPCQSASLYSPVLFALSFPSPQRISDFPHFSTYLSLHLYFFLFLVTNYSKTSCSQTLISQVSDILNTPAPQTKIRLKSDKAGLRSAFFQFSVSTAAFIASVSHCLHLTSHTSFIVQLFYLAGACSSHMDSRATKRRKGTTCSITLTSKYNNIYYSPVRPCAVCTLEGGQGETNKVNGLIRQ